MQVVKAPLLLLVAGCLSGCIAAAVPLAAAGGVAASATARPDRTSREERRAAKRAAKQAKREQAAAPPLPTPKPLPSDPAQRRAGQFYAGSLPRPDGGIAPPAPTAEVQPAPITPPSVSNGDTPPVVSPARATWADLGHYVAGHLPATRSVLLVRGSDSADPRWMTCEGKEPAVLAPVSASLGPVPANGIGEQARQWLGALNTIGVKLVFVAADDGQAEVARAALAKAGLPAPVAGDTLLVGGSAVSVRANVAARYCVVAVAGRVAADFPNALTPATSPPALQQIWGAGWFLFGDKPAAP